MMYVKAGNMVSNIRQQLINVFSIFNLKFKFLVVQFCKFLGLLDHHQDIYQMIFLDMKSESEREGFCGICQLLVICVIIASSVPSFFLSFHLTYI